MPAEKVFSGAALMDLSRAFNASNHELHCVESFRIWSFSGPIFPVFGLSRVI